MPDLNKAYTWAIQTCNAPNIGYSMDKDLRNQGTRNGITYYDCSSFINYALLAGGWETPGYAPNHNPLTTWTLIDELPRLGWSQVDPHGLLLPGDIGVSNTSTSHHTEMCYSEGEGQAVFMGAHGSQGIELPNQVSIGSSSGDATYTRTFQTMWRYGAGDATGYGVALPVIAAICGNSWQESTINSGLEEAVTHNGWGLFQWSFDRRTALEAWLTTNGYALDDPYGQLQYLIVENEWTQVEPYPFATLEEFLQSTSTDIEMLTRAWEDCWERSGDDETLIQQRIRYANTCYDYIRAHAQDTSIIDWYISSSYLPEEQTLNNAVMMYRYLSAGGGGGGTIVDEKKTMPLWMKIRYHY